MQSLKVFSQREYICVTTTKIKKKNVTNIPEVLSTLPFQLFSPQIDTIRISSTTDCFYLRQNGCFVFSLHFLLLPEVQEGLWTLSEAKFKYKQLSFLVVVLKGGHRPAATPQIFMRNANSRFPPWTQRIRNSGGGAQQSPDKLMHLALEKTCFVGA